MDDFDLEVEFLLEPDERDHDFGLHFDAGLLDLGAISKLDVGLTPLSAMPTLACEFEIEEALRERGTAQSKPAHPDVSI